MLEINTIQNDEIEQLETQLEELKIELLKDEEEFNNKKKLYNKLKDKIRYQKIKREIDSWPEWKKEAARTSGSLLSD